MDRLSREVQHQTAQIPWPDRNIFVSAISNQVLLNQKRLKSFARKLVASCAAAFLALPFIPSAIGFEKPPHKDRVSSDQSLDDGGELVARVRVQVLALLQTENACAAWFKESEPDAAGVFASLRIEIGERKPAYVVHMKNEDGDNRFKHPWAARTTQAGGRDSLIWLNPGGPFFNSSSLVVDLDPMSALLIPGTTRRLFVGSFAGSTNEAQMATLIHELGHVVGRIPEDDDSWDGRSSRNTEEVMKHCKHEIRSIAKNGVVEQREITAGSCVPARLNGSHANSVPETAPDITREHLRAALTRDRE